MNIARKKNKDTTTLVFEGDLTIYTVAHLKEELFADYETLAEQVAFDLAAVGEIDTAGVQLLLFAKKFLASVHKKMSIINTNELIDSVFSALDVSAHFAPEH